MNQSAFVARTRPYRSDVCSLAFRRLQFSIQRSALSVQYHSRFILRIANRRGNGQLDKMSKNISRFHRPAGSSAFRFASALLSIQILVSREDHRRRDVAGLGGESSSGPEFCHPSPCLRVTVSPRPWVAGMARAAALHPCHRRNPWLSLLGERPLWLAPQLL